MLTVSLRACIGKAGWQGDDCSTVDQQVYQCLPGCSERGTYDLETGTCICDRHWTGPDCSQGKCVCVLCLLTFPPFLRFDNQNERKRNAQHLMEFVYHIIAGTAIATKPTKRNERERGR